MKKICLIFIVLILSMCFVNADTLPTNLRLIKNKSKITYNADTLSWSEKIQKNTTDYYVKTKLNDNFSYYLPSGNQEGFSTDCNFDFIKNGQLIGYSNNDFKFYKFYIADGVITKEKLTFEETERLIPNFKIIKISDLNNNTNSIKIKKHLKDLDIFIYNDTDDNLENYTFTSGNSKIKTYSMSGFVTVSQKGMIQFSGGFVNTKETPWYVILVR